MGCRQKVLVVSLLVLLSGSAAHANLIVNGDFETGDLTGWTWTLTPNADPSVSPAVVSFDTSGTGASLAFRVNPGRRPGASGEGGLTLSQTVNLIAGLECDVALGALAIRDTGGGDNSDGGLIRLYIEDELQWSWDVARIAAGATVRNSYAGTYVPTFSGPHDVDVVFTRTPESGSPPVMYHYADNISIAPVPEPGTLALLGVGLGALVRRRRKRREGRR